MSLVDLQSEVEGYRAQAGQLAEEFSRVHAEVAANQNLSLTGKREQLEPLHAEVTQRISALHAREKAAVQGLKEKLERRAFGLTSTAANDPARVVSFRDAQTRARQIEDSNDADEIYQSALRSGDNIMATAILERALVRGWSKIKQDFLDRNPSTRDDLDNLGALAKYSDNAFANLVHYMPPNLDLPHSAGMPEIKPLHTRAEPKRPPPLADVMGQAAARAEAAQYPYGR